ncbi:MAG: HlyD family efflux transporter periplasmic adaptor subunit [Planctomycetes bacterium]|nr:HlyD family efflux transporter periplasmic adaptor subunit [Planctomycetota bacterium]
MKPKWLMTLLAVVLAACQTEPPPPPAGGDAAAAKPTNRIDIPPAVVANLGITFARVERRHVEQTLRLPGAFESTPEALTAHTTPLAGRVTLLVKQYQRVEQGQPLFRVESPELVALLHEIADADAETAQREAEAAIARAELNTVGRAVANWPARLAAVEAALAASDEHAANLQAARDLWAARVRQLEDLDKAGGGRAGELAEARSRLADAESEISNERETRAGFAAQLAELKAGQDTDQARLAGLGTAVEKADSATAAARVHARMVRHRAALMLGVKPGDLDGDGWRGLETFSAAAAGTGVVTEIGATEGEFIAAGTVVARVLDDTALRFRARALQADLGLLADGLDAAIVPPAGGPLAAAGAIAGKLTIAPAADPDIRTVDVIVVPQSRANWARAGVTAELEVIYDRTPEARLAVPLACVMPDGLERVLFRRDPADPNKVIRVAASLGPSDGRWIVIYTGVIEDDEVVLGGAYELKLTGAGKTTGKGHFHADGTWHEGDH